ncbi:TPA: DUF805 domain-containing protein [Enterococcus hirae]
MLKAYKEYWLRAFDYKGVTDRRSYRFVFLCNLIVSFVCGLLLGLTLDHEKILFYMVILIGVFFVVTFILNISLTVRRLRDIGTHWGWVVFLFVPYLVYVLEVVLLFAPSNILKSVKKSQRLSRKLNIRKKEEKEL